jgi:hypothetical protein
MLAIRRPDPSPGQGHLVFDGEREEAKGAKASGTEANPSVFRVPPERIRFAFFAPFAPSRALPPEK